jgi:ribonuclease T2
MSKYLASRQLTDFASFVSALLALAFVAGDALAQSVPYRERPGAYNRSDTRGDRGDKPGEFDHYILALSWSPSYCSGLREGRRDPQCEGRPYAFVLHGLWPQNERGWPQDCQSPDRGWVPAPAAERMLDIMPSKRLVFHEYRKHGTCTGLGVDGYFDLSRKLYEKVKIPRKFVGLTDDRFTIAPGELVREFLSVNPQLKPDMIAVECGGAGNRLKEVRVCFDKGGNFRSCGRNVDQAKLCAADRMYVPPVRAGGGDGAAAPAPDRREPPVRDVLPGPRDQRRL